MTLLLFLGMGVSGLLHRSPCAGGWWWQCQQGVTPQSALHARTDEALQLVVQHMPLQLLLPPCSCFPQSGSVSISRVCAKGAGRQISPWQQNYCVSGEGRWVEVALLGTTQ